ncbi:transcriptional regulator [Candidatus Poriferisodalis sp.]|uniref:transcriptional regulator n=1 Tax=Candidatus Poriferisodalis sp. TaxID=3101277 RepID=UPI003D0F6E3E
MQQITWRADEELVARIKMSAQEQRISMNEYLTWIAQAATDPSLSSNAIEEIRSRLRLAGLLSDFEARDTVRPDDDAVAAARRRAGQGTPLSELVRANR